MALRGSDPGAGLVALLDERAAHFAGRTTADAERLRGLALAALEGTGMPVTAIPFVLEELESGRNPSNVAAAGRAVRGAGPHLPAEAPALLVGAIARLRASDDRVRFPTGSDGSLTVLADLGATLAQLGPAASSAARALGEMLAAHGDELSPKVRASMLVALEAMRAAPAPCCDHHAEPVEATAVGDATLVRALLLEDQDGRTQSFEERFAGRPTAVAFFYTRCTNPERCSLTVTRLASLDRRLRGAGIDANVAAISYDARYDRPPRLRAYGTDRGMVFSSRCSLLRTVDRVDPFVEAFGLGVGFGPVTVNQHGLDLVLLDPHLEVVRRHARRLWPEDDVIDDLARAARR
jgi:protein SCO1/2